MALEIEEMEETVDTLNDYAEELDEDLGDVEDYLFGEDECDCDCDDELLHGASLVARTIPLMAVGVECFAAFRIRADRAARQGGCQGLASR
jgi:hypothetical protein